MAGSAQTLSVKLSPGKNSLADADVLEGKEKVLVLKLGSAARGSLKIGRNPKGSVHVQSVPGVSWNHVELKLVAVEGGLVLRAIDASSNGTGLQLKGEETKKMPKGEEVSIPPGSTLVLPWAVKTQRVAFQVDYTTSAKEAALSPKEATRRSSTTASKRESDVKKKDQEPTMLVVDDEDSSGDERERRKEAEKQKEASKVKDAEKREKEKAKDQNEKEKDKDKEGSHRPDSMSPGGAAVPRQQPSHCDAVPPFLALAWCTPGQKTCVCESYCQLSVSPSSWASDPNCCDCSLSLIPAITPPTRPLYCEHLPATIKLPWCEGLHGCNCQSFCASAVAPTQWGWDSQCCACRYSEIFAAKGPLKAIPDSIDITTPDNLTSLVLPPRVPETKEAIALAENGNTVEEALSFDEVQGRWRRCAAWRNPRCQRLGSDGRCIVWGSRQCIRWALLEETASSQMQNFEDASAKVPSFCRYLDAADRPASCDPAALATTASCGCDATCAFIPQGSHEWTTACCGCTRT
mmetsp:Transcript_77350/g.169225  ORF Transcript_77350/g.169225 Transcript_77350/m.169225 type:complete len:519 (-) Transcript_77350:216-1772(-)